MRDIFLPAVGGTFGYIVVTALSKGLDSLAVVAFIGFSALIGYIIADARDY